MSTLLSDIDQKTNTAETRSNILAPKLRFKGFFDDWSMKKIGEVYKIKHGFAFKGEFFNSEGPYIVLTPGNFNLEVGGFRYQGSKEKYYTDTEFPKEYILKEGDLLTVMTEQASGLIGSPLIVPQSGIFLHNQRLGLFQLKGGVKSEFLFYSMTTSSLRSKFSKSAAGTKVRHTSPQLIEDIGFSFPSLPEQQKIASFLSAVDEKIQQLTRKKELLDQYKKGVMQQLFSGELRFKPAQSEVEGDENGEAFPEWEWKRLGDVANIKRGASPRPITDPKWFDSKSKIGWVRISDVTKSNKYLNETVQYLSVEGIEKSRLVKKGSMIMSICATIGKPIYTKFDVCIHDGFVVFENLQADKEFLYYYLDKIQLGWYRYGQPGSQVNLNIEIVSNESMPYPSIPEQQKIATYLSSIDTKIESVTNQITQTQSYKKGLLQLMFV